MHSDSLTQFQAFRESLHSKLTYWSYATFELIESLASYGSEVRQATGLSLSPCFQRQYPAITKVIGAFAQGSRSDDTGYTFAHWEAAYRASIAELMPAPFFDRYHVFGTDVTSIEKVYSSCHADRQFVYQASKGKHQRPIVIGHKNSCLAAFSPDPRWLIPLSMRRVGSKEKENQVGFEQLEAVLNDPSLNLGDRTCIHLGDTTYSRIPFLYQGYQHDSLVVISRLHGNRTLYQLPEPVKGPRKPGCPRKYGASFNLKKPETWPEPHAQAKWEIQPQKGQKQFIEAIEFRDVLVRGKRKMDMSKIPLRVIGFRLLDEQGNQKLERMLWVVMCGKKRDEPTLKQCWVMVRKRFDLEHFFRFAKQKLLLNKFQSPSVAHMENWWQIVCCAYALLYAARTLAKNCPYPWQKYLEIYQAPAEQQAVKVPAMVQKDYYRIIQLLEPITQPPRKVKKSKGRKKGQKLPPRVRYKPVKKSKNVA